MSDRLRRDQLHGTEMTDAEERIPDRAQKDRTAYALDCGLPSAMSVKDRTIPLFNRSFRTCSCICSE